MQLFRVCLNGLAWFAIWPHIIRVTFYLTIRVLWLCSCVLYCHWESSDCSDKMLAVMMLHIVYEIFLILETFLTECHLYICDVYGLLSSNPVESIQSRDSCIWCTNLSRHFVFLYCLFVFVSLYFASLHVTVDICMHDCIPQGSTGRDCA